MDGRMEYSILKEKIKENECGWSKTVHTGTAIPTAPGHGGMVVSLFTVHSPAAGDCKSGHNRSARPVECHIQRRPGRTLRVRPAHPRAIPNHPLSSSLPQQKREGERDSSSISQFRSWGADRVPRRRGAPPCRAPVGIQHSAAAANGIQRSAAPARPGTVDDLRRAVGRRRHDRSPAPLPSEIPASPWLRPPRARAPPLESRAATLGELRG
jgi:hypothetical protein